MPYLYRTLNGAEARKEAQEIAPFPEEQVPQVEKIEIWASSFTDPGEDYCLVHYFDAKGNSLGSRRRAGY